MRVAILTFISDNVSIAEKNLCTIICSIISLFIHFFILIIIQSEFFIYINMTFCLSVGWSIVGLLDFSLIVFVCLFNFHLVTVVVIVGVVVDVVVVYYQP